MGRRMQKGKESFIKVLWVLPYRISKIRKYCNVNISNILLDKEDVGFIDFCTINGFNNLLALILLPYYSKGILDRFDTETIERVVKEVKVFLDMHILYEDYITSNDIEGEWHGFQGVTDKEKLYKSGFG